MSARASAAAQRLSVELHIDDAAWTNDVILIDRAGIEQVVTNLVINAAQAAGAGGNVWLRTRRDGDEYFVIEVVRRRPGIPRRRPAANLRAVLHDQADGSGHRTRPVGLARQSCSSTADGSRSESRVRVRARARSSPFGSHCCYHAACSATCHRLAGTGRREPTAARADRRRRSDDSPGADPLLPASRMGRHPGRNGVAGARAADRRREAFDLVISDVKMPGCPASSCMPRCEAHTTRNARSSGVLHRRNGVGGRVGVRLPKRAVVSCSSHSI